MPSHLQPPLWRRTASGSSLDAVFAPAQSRGTTLHELLGAVAHEIRSPLTLLRGEAALMRRRCTDPEAVREASDAIDRQVSQIAGFLQDLVALADDADAIEPPQHIAVSELLANARRALGDVFDERLTRVTIGRLEPSAVVGGDPERLERALGSILVTLASAAALRGRVVMHTANDADDVVISLVSHGAQIAADLLPTLFDPFVRALYGLRAEGVGLGAARRTIAAHGGSIKVQNTEDGTEFVVRLPRAVR